MSGVEQVLAVIGAPLFASLFSAGLKPGVDLPGLPFIVASALVLLAAGLAGAAFNTADPGRPAEDGDVEMEAAGSHLQQRGPSDATCTSPLNRDLR